MNDPLHVVRVGANVSVPFIKAHHYSRTSHGGPVGYARYEDGAIVSMATFTVGCSQAARARLLGPEYTDRVWELARVVNLHPSRDTGRFVAAALRCFRMDYPRVAAVVTFADPTEGHHGGLYQALNALYLGRSGAATFYRDQDGALRHPRQNGVNISRSEAESRGWTVERREGKHRYVWLLGSPSQRRHLRNSLGYDVLPYPKPNPPNNPP